MIHIVNKEYRIVTAPVIQPGVPDCDYNRGEKPLTTQQVKQLMTSFKNYNIIDYDHNFTLNGKWYMKNLGIPLELWQSETETKYLDIFDVERTAPKGSWWLKSMITNPEAIQELDSGKLNSYSLTTANKSFADRFMESYNPLSNKSIPFDELDLLCKKYNMNFKHRTLIKDIRDPVGFTVSLTGFPCVGGAVFAKKCYEASQQSNKHKGDKMSEGINLSFENFKELLSLKSKKEDDNVYVTMEELDKKLEEHDKSLTDNIAKIIDEKIPSDKGDDKGDDKGSDDKGSQDDAGDKGQTDDKGSDDKGSDDKGSDDKGSQDNTGQQSQDQTSNKNNPGSKQIPHQNDGDDDQSFKRGTPEYNLLKQLGRDAMGNSKIKL